MGKDMPDDTESRVSINTKAWPISDASIPRSFKVHSLSPLQVCSSSFSSEENRHSASHEMLNDHNFDEFLRLIGCNICGN